MNFSFKQLKLSTTLLLLTIFPLVLTIIAVAYFGIKNLQTVKDHPVLITLILLLIVVYIPTAFLIIRRISKGVDELENVSGDLASGKLGIKISANGLEQTSKIGLALNQLQGDATRQAQFAEQIKSGNLEVVYEPRHANDQLGKALLSIKENLITIKQEDQQRNWASEGLARFVAVLQSAKNLKDLSNDIIVTLVRIIQANQGAIFIVDDKEGDEALEMQACYAYNRTKFLEQRIALGEGIIGQAFLEKATVYLKDVPDQFVRITSGLGEANPKYILIVPLMMNETIVGIIEIASFREFRPHEITFVEKIGENIAYTVSSMRIAESTRKMLDEMNEQAEQMRAQEEELRQNQEELQATQETISRKYDALFKKLGDLNYQSRFDQLMSINSTKKLSVEYYFDIIRSQTLTFADDRMIIDAVKEFKKAFYKVASGLSPEQVSQAKESLHTFYENDFIPRLNDNFNQVAKADQFMPANDISVQLQYLFISSNPHPTGKKSLLDRAADESEYSDVHARYHPILRDFLEKFGYYDIFLIDAETGDMLYSVFKEVDFGTNLIDGKYHTTNFGKVVKKAIQSTDINFVQLIDFEPYDPSYHAPASFIASPVYDGDQKIGILVFQMPINKINQILTGNNKWQEDGLGESGETFIVGSDYRYRSIARELIENPNSYLDSLKKQKYTESILQQIKKMETNILMAEVRQESVAKALNGSTGTQLERNSLGIDMLSAYTPLNIADVHWILLSTMKEEEASARINDLREGNLE